MRRQPWYQLPLQLQEERPDVVRTSRLAQEMQVLLQQLREFHDCPRILESLHRRAREVAEKILAGE